MFVLTHGLGGGTILTAGLGASAAASTSTSSSGGPSRGPRRIIDSVWEQIQRDDEEILIIIKEFLAHV